jgi:hypothetical protein
MIFDEFDENTSDFFMQINRQGKEVDISNAIPTLLVLKPSGTAVSQILNVKDNLIYGNLNNSLKNEVGTYIAKLMLVEGDKKTFISNISYEVTENALLGKIDNDIVEDERYSVLIQLLERLSNIELQEQIRIDNENSRVEAENLRQESIEKIKNDIDNLINETKEELNEYKNNKDISINNDLKEFKENTNKSIENYKTSKDVEITNSLNIYKSNTTNDINNFKNTVNSKIDKYKNDKDKAINEYIEGKSLELDNYVEAKNNELDLYVSKKEILIDSKISEVDSAKTQMQDSINNKLVEVDNAETQRQQEHEERQQLLNGFEGKLNTVVDDVAGIKDDVVSVREANKRQDVFLQGLYNENLDGRVTIKEEGSVIPLTNSDDGLVDIVRLEGNTLVNYCTDGAKELTLNGDVDVEGTSVTLTEGVDNGLVDVMCEGNTLVNLCSKEAENTHLDSSNYKDYTIQSNISHNTPNIIFVLNKDIVSNGVYTLKISTQAPNECYQVDVKLRDVDANISYNIKTYDITSNKSIDDIVSFLPNSSFTPKNDCGLQIIYHFDSVKNAQGKTLIIEPPMIFEGDLTQTPELIPTEYFEGMKSVGECEDNKLEILSTNSDNTLSNKKEITLSEPLRALPSGVCDKVIKIGGKWYVERNCGSIVLDGSEPHIALYNQNDTHIVFQFTNELYFLSGNYVSQGMSINDRGFSSSHAMNVVQLIDSFGIGLSDAYLYLSMPKNMLNSPDKTGFKQWLQNNPITVIYQLKTPIYEEITDPTVKTYNDITHISNNSTIPCNMTVKNTGYNAIIKPSTQYTVAFDTDESGEVGINLGGAKVTTTNNVATVTTPSTLVDDSLRLHGKGIKASKVRLLEGDKTNWIPSYFEGLQSSFEDKLQDDGTYKMEILSEGKNKLNGYNFARSIFNSAKNSVLDTENKTIKYNASDINNVILKSIKFKKNTRYTIILKGFNSNEAMQSTNLKVVYTDGSTHICNDFINGISEIVTNAGKTVSHLIGNWSTFSTTLYYDECGIFEGVKVPFEPYKYHNKIQFSSIEPLRGVGDVKDRFVFKDSKLMIERNCAELIINDTNPYSISDNNPSYPSVLRIWYDESKLQNWKSAKSLCDTLPSYDSMNKNAIGIGHSNGFDIHLPLPTTSTISEVREHLKNNPLKVVHQLKESIYEEIPFELQKIILEGYINGTLFFDTNIPPTVTASYTANIPLVSKVNKVNEVIETNTEDIAITQMAVDFLLMSTLGEEMLNFKVKSGYNMASYFASRIIKEALKYEDVIRKYPNYKEDINLILVSEGYSDLIAEL